MKQKWSDFPDLWKKKKKGDEEDKNKRTKELRREMIKKDWNLQEWKMEQVMVY